MVRISIKRIRAINPLFGLLLVYVLLFVQKNLLFSISKRKSDFQIHQHHTRLNTNINRKMIDTKLSSSYWRRVQTLIIKILMPVTLLLSELIEYAAAFVSIWSLCWNLFFNCLSKIATRLESYPAIDREWRRYQSSRFWRASFSLWSRWSAPWSLLYSFDFLFFCFHVKKL